MSTASSRAGGSAGTAATSGGSSSMATALADGHDYGISGASFGTDASGNAPLVTPGVGSPFYPPQVREDFLLVSEFSEHEGPRPVFTLPDSMMEASHMNLNSFVLRTMAVDYQARVGYAASSAALCWCSVGPELIETDCSLGRPCWRAGPTPSTCPRTARCT